MASCTSSPADNLEFYLKFPSPNFNYQALASDNEGNFLIDEKQVPVVLLLGWAGCQDKYLAKYSMIYEDKGLITIRYTAPVNCLFWKRREMIKLGEKLANLIVEMNFENHPIIVHLFSNGGAFLYQHLSLAIQKLNKPIQIRGVILDSAPGERRVSAMYGAISAIIGGSVFYNISMSLLTTIFICLIWLFEIISIKLSRSKNLPSNPFGNLKDEIFLWPQHFIFSKADDLIPYTDIEKFVQFRRQKGVDTTTLCFEDSPHVKHFIQYKDIYVRSVYTFVKKCLASERNYYNSKENVSKKLK